MQTVKVYSKKAILFTVFKYSAFGKSLCT